MQKLTVQLLKAEAKAFADNESNHKEKSLYGVTDGKARNMSMTLRHSLSAFSVYFPHSLASSAY